MPELQYIEVSKIYPHPDNPRKNLGDIQELSDSIKANGVLQNLTVVPMSNGQYTVVIGHRRLAAAKKAGLSVVPCVAMEMTPQEQVRTMLMENIQRSDLTVYEQAQGFQMMLDMGETVESIAKDCGFSQSTVRRRVRLLELDADKFKKSEARGATLQDYAQLEKIETPELKNKALDAIGTANFRDVLKKAIEEEKNLRRMAQWETDLEAFALKIEKRDCVGSTTVPMDYVTNYGIWSPKDMNNDERILIRYVCDGDMRRAQMQARCILGAITSHRDAAFRDDMIRRIEARKDFVKLPDSLEGLLAVDDSAVFPEAKFLLRKTETEAAEKTISLYRAAERLANMGIPYLPALMLYGESGCGKTELARYIAHRAELPLAPPLTSCAATSSK